MRHGRVVVKAAAGSWLVIGCGYVGARVVAQLRAREARIAIVTRDAARAAAFAAQGAQMLVGDYADAARLLAFGAALPSPLRVLCLLPPSGCQDDAGTLAPLERLVGTLRQLAPASALLSSSTGVYGEQGSRVVTAESACLPASPRERRLGEIERCWREMPVARVVRFAGLYGPGRVVGLQGVRAGHPVPGDPDGYLNLIHAADAAALLVQAALGAAAAIELGADGSPVTRRVYYRTLAGLCGAPPPRFSGEPATRGGGYRRCDPSTTCERLQWRPMFRDFRAGLAALGDELIRE